MKSPEQQLRMLDKLWSQILKCVPETLVNLYRKGEDKLKVLLNQKTLKLLMGLSSGSTACSLFWWSSFV